MLLVWLACEEHVLTQTQKVLTTFVGLVALTRTRGGTVVRSERAAAFISLRLRRSLLRTQIKIVIMTIKVSLVMR